MLTRQENQELLEPRVEVRMWITPHYVYYRSEYKGKEHLEELLSPYRIAGNFREVKFSL